MRIPIFFTRIFDELKLSESNRQFIVESYSAKGRFYHTLPHLAIMYHYMINDKPIHRRSGTSFRHSANRRVFQADAYEEYSREMLHALIFHDVIYDPLAKKGDNERNSAAEFRLRITDPDINHELVVEMILRTIDHELNWQTSGANTIRDWAINAFLFADLSILWHPNPRVYEWYAKGVRQEYAWVPNDQYRTGRANVLETLMVSMRSSLLSDDREIASRNAAWETIALSEGMFDL